MELALAMVMDTLVLRDVSDLHVVPLLHWIVSVLTLVPTLAQRLLFSIQPSAV